MLKNKKKLLIFIKDIILIPFLWYALLLDITTTRYKIIKICDIGIGFASLLDILADILQKNIPTEVILMFSMWFRIGINYLIRNMGMGI